jgi:endonuclease G
VRRVLSIITAVALFVALLPTHALMRQTTDLSVARRFCQGFAQYGLPDQQKKSDMYLCRDGYLVGYNFKTKEPNWVVYRLTEKSVSAHIKRQNNFAPDLTIPVPYRAELSDYKHSGYDRGHLAPYAAMDFSQESARQSFLLSNMAPQKAQLNRQGWARLESDVRCWAKSLKEVYVVTGVIFKNQTPCKFIGKNKVAVPDYFYKVIYAPKQHRAIAFVMPNAPVKKNQVSQYRDTIINIEQRTGMQFLSALSAHQRDLLIHSVSKMWSLS